MYECPMYEEPLGGTKRFLQTSGRLMLSFGYQYNDPYLRSML